MLKFFDKIKYSERYEDDQWIYRHVHLSKESYQKMKLCYSRGQLLTEEEWRGLGIEMSLGWIHYAFHTPEPQILLFRRPKCENQ